MTPRFGKNATSNSLRKNNYNYISKPNNVNYPNRDIETNAQKPWDVSTAYIRNAPMESPWELGLIHRGQKWKTINLKKFNTAEGVKDGAGGDAYSEGDANILNQVKMSDATETYGKININSDNLDALKILFQKIRVGSFTDHTNPENVNMYPGWLTNREIDSDKAEDLATELKNIYDKKNPFKSRAEILNGNVNEFRRLVTGDDNYLYLDQNNDAEKEEIIGKFINKAATILGSSDTLRIIAMGESIKDLGNVTIGGKKYKEGVFDIGVDKILASEKIFAVIGSREDSETANKKVFYIQKFKYVN